MYGEVESRGPSAAEVGEVTIAFWREKWTCEPSSDLYHRSVPFTVLRGRHHAYSLQAHTNDHKRKRAAVRKADHKRLDVITLAPMSMAVLGVHGFGPDSRLRGARTARRARGRESKKCDGRSAASENRAQSPRPAGRDTSFITHETAPFWRIPEKHPPISPRTERAQIAHHLGR